MKVSFINKTIFLAVAALFLALAARAQPESVDKFEEKFLRIYIKRLTVKPSTDDAYGGFTVNFAWMKNRTGKWEQRFYWEQTLFSDAIAGIVKKYVMKKDITKSGLDHSFSSGLFGSFQWGLNAVVKEDLIVAPCVSFGDYVIAAHRFEDTKNLSGLDIYSGPGKIYRDPAGYYFVAGPAVMASYFPAGGYWLDGFMAYELTAYNVGEMNLINFVHEEGYPNPHFITLGANINRGGLFGGFRLSKLINRGHTNTGLTRIDLNLGLNIGS